jgi:hypothetical protein
MIIDIVVDQADCGALLRSARARPGPNATWPSLIYFMTVVTDFVPSVAALISAQFSRVVSF